MECCGERKKKGDGMINLKKKIKVTFEKGENHQSIAEKWRKATGRTLYPQGHDET